MLESTRMLYLPVACLRGFLMALEHERVWHLLVLLQALDLPLIRVYLSTQAMSLLVRHLNDFRRHMSILLKLLVVHQLRRCMDLLNTGTGNVI